MSMPADLVSVTKTSAVTAIVDQRIHPNMLPFQVWTDDGKRPSICYFWSQDQPGSTFCETDDLRRSRFTFHCSAADYDTSVLLAQALEDAILDYVGISGGTSIEAVHLEAAADNAVEEDPGIYTRSLLFAVWHQPQE